jgi:hypothetical protein
VYFTAYRVLKACVKLARTVPSVRPSVLFGISNSVHPDLA